MDHDTTSAENPARPPSLTRRERRHARTRRRVATFVVAPLALAVLVVATMGAAPSRGAEPFAADADETIADIQSYWATTMPSVYGEAYQAISADRLFPYSQADPPPGCGTRGDTPYAEVAGNAFYCSEGDFVAWDAQQLFPKLTQQFGAFAPALVLAHEWGHAIQARVGFDADESVYVEQQADCFAGAWAGHVASGGSDLSVSSDDLDRALAGMLQLSDPVGIDSGQDGAHGNGFDRVGAFQDGVEGGASACAAYETDPPAVTESGFTSSADYATGGDMSLSALLPELERALDTYWSNAVGTKFESPKLVASTGSASCDGSSDGGVLVDSVVYCADSNTVVYDPATLREAHSSVGDFAAGILLATGWSSAVQHDLGRAIEGKTAWRSAECLAGAFSAGVDGSRSRSSSSSTMTLSPGDLDEVVSMLVGAHGGDERGTAFERVAAFRTGWSKGASACTKS